MKEGSIIDYHLRELDIAQDPGSRSHILPDFSEDDRSILDIGCGIGQTLSVAQQRDGRLLVGLDVDYESLRYGQSRLEQVRLVNAAAEALPFRDGSFDFVYSRVTLPYTNIPGALSEIRRVLRPAGGVWLTLHPFSMLLRDFKNSLFRLKFKDAVFRFYVFANGVTFSLSGRMFAFPFRGRYESFQSRAGIVKFLRKAGFGNLKVSKGRHFVVTGRKTG